MFPLPSGDLVFGRSPYADLQVLDPSLSRRHARLRVCPDGIRLQDLGSVNGTTVNGSGVGPDWIPVTPDARIEAGGSVLRLCPAAPQRPGPARAEATDAQGTIPIPIPVPPMAAPETVAGEPVTLRYPRTPSRPDQRRASPVLLLATALVPLAMAAALALALRNWLYLGIGLFGPLTAAIHLFVDRRTSRARGVEAADRYDAALAAVERDLRRVLDRERAAGHAEHPPLPSVLACATGREPSLWQGFAAGDTWAVRVGCGDVPAHIRVVRDDQTTRPANPDCPLLIRLDGRAVAVRGSEDDVAGLARSILVQLAVRLPPDRCRLRLDEEAARLVGAAWPPWLPHLTGDDAPADPERDLLVLAGSPGNPARGRGNLPHGRPPGARAVIVLVPDPVDAPPWCEVTAQVAAGRVSLTATRPGLLDGADPRTRMEPAAPEDLERTGRAELLHLRHAAPAARALAALRPQHGTATYPSAQGGLLSRLRLGDTEPALTGSLRTAWSTTEHGTARVLLGDLLDGTGEACELDLDRDGPHLLLAGMTGSGKSELLTTLVAGLVLRHPPQELALVLMDYKGGSAFAPFASLPHTVGLLTDLDPDATARALRALGAELRHREAVLRSAGVGDIRAYRQFRRRHPQAEPLPRLVVVVDEYRVLAEDHAPLMSALVRIAGLGRGLGLHLVLATQRPGGIVSAEIRANVNARIALRVRDVAESHDVIDSAAAATVDPHTPGRGYLRVGSCAPVAFQALRASTPVRRELTTPVRVTRRSGPGPSPRAGDQPSGGTSPATPNVSSERDIDVIVAAAIAAATHDGHRRPPPIWAPPLPPEVRLTLPATPDPHRQDRPPAWPYALADDPDGRAVEPLSWRPLEQGHLALVGTGRTGRTEAVAALLVALSRSCPGTVQVFVIDAAGGLAAAGPLPHCAGLVGTDDVGAVRRLVDVVHRLSSAAAAAGGDPPITVLVVHGWEQLCSALDGVDHGRTSARLLELFRAGPAGRVRVLVTGDRALLSGTVAGLVEQKVVLRLADPRDALIAGLRQPATLGPGRGVHLPSGRVVQLARADAQELSDAAAAAQEAHPRCPLPTRLRPLPRRVHAEDVPPVEEPSRLTIGVTVDGSAAWVPTGGTLLVVGPPGSGRTTTLRVIAERAAEHRLPVAVVRAGGCRPDPDRTSPDPGGTWPDPGGTWPDPGGTWPDPRGCPPPILLADDVDELPATDQARLADLAADGVPVVAALRTASAAQSYTGLVGRLRRGDAVILSPTPADGQLLGVRIEGGEPPIPGRATLVRRGVPQPIQIALPAAANPGPP